MAKTSKEQIEKDEQKILLELQKDSNQSLDIIAKKTKFSRQKVWRIVKNLEENKDIWGYTAIVDEQKLGMKTYLLLFKTNIGDVQQLLNNPDFFKMIDKQGIYMRNISWSHGIFDGHLFFMARDIPHAKQFQQTFISMYHDHVCDVELLETIGNIQRGGQANPHE
jgi:DNA-binding Lrp family transcriptional regulator